MKEPWIEYLERANAPITGMALLQSGWIEDCPGTLDTDWSPKIAVFGKLGAPRVVRVTEIPSPSRQDRKHSDSFFIEVPELRAEFAK